MIRYSIEPTARKDAKGYAFLPFPRNLSNEYKNLLLDAGNALKCFHALKVVHKTGDCLGNKIVYAVANLSNYETVKTKPVEEIIIPPE